MRDHSTDEIRDLLAHAMADSPEPHPWADIEQRAGRHAAPTSQPRQNGVWLVATACVAVLVAGLSAVAVYHDEPNLPTDSPAPLTVAPTPAPTTSTTPTSLPPDGLVELTSDTPMLWAGGVLVAAWVDEQFVPVAQTAGLPPELLGTPIELAGPVGVGNSRTWTPETDECGTPRLQVPEADRVDASNPRYRGHPYGLLRSESYPQPEASNGATVRDRADLDAALNNLGVDPGQVSAFVSSEDLDGNPDVEVVISRFDPTVKIDDQRTQAWLAVWDPADASIMTVAGDPETNDIHFAVDSQFVDVDANGRFDTVIDTGDAVTLVELSTGEVLSSVATTCPDPEDDGVFDIPAEWVPLGDLDRKGLRPLATLSPVDGDLVIPTAPTDWFLPPFASIYPDPGNEQPGQVFDVVTTPGSGDRPAEIIRVGVIPICARDDTDCAANMAELPVAAGSMDTVDIGGNTWAYDEWDSVFTVFGDYFVNIFGGRYPHFGVFLLEDPAILGFIEGLRVGSAADLPEQVVMFVEGTNTPISRTAENSDESADVPGSD